MRIPDGAYQAMLSAIREDRTPNLLLLSYKQLTWQVLDVLIIPHFAFSEQAIIPRKALASTARRAGWIGCNIDLSQIAPEARISIIRNGEIVPSTVVSERFSKLKPLSQLKSSERGWTLAVLNAIQSAGWVEFTTCEAYRFEDQLGKIFPSNHHVRQKIRQRLQVLRDMGLLLHVKRGVWKIPP
jgi:type II restriction enzyme